MDQQNQIENQDGITFVDLVKMFRGKLKFIICIALIAAVIGGAAGVALSLISVDYTGSLQFYITPGDDAHKLLPLLQSDSFAEKLLLDEYGLPESADKTSQEYIDAKNAAIAAEEAREKKQELIKEYNKIPYEIAIIEDNYTKLSKKYDNIVNELSIYKSAESGSALEALDPEHKAKVAALEAELEVARQAMEKYAQEQYYPLVQTKLQMNQEINTARLEWKEAREDAEEKAEKLLAPWRENIEVRKKISTIQRSLTYEYAKIVEDDKTSTEVKNQNQAFLVVSINVSDDEELAEDILFGLKSILPDYAEKNVEIITGTNEAECKIVSTFASLKNSTSTGLIKNAATYALLAAVIVVFIFCIAVVFKNMLGKELSDKEDKETKDSTAA